ncbi:MAG: protein kinase [Planctomycetes bacterium]|nr:protein kinase [Planctomycetota bacterium]
MPADEESRVRRRTTTLPDSRPLSDMPSQIDGHTLIREIGRGGMGVVYLAREEGWGREVALKVVPQGLSKRQVRRFIEEAHVTGQLQHPAIVPIYRIGRTSDGRDYYTMKRVQGETLAQILAQLGDATSKAQERYGPRRLASILLSVCEGVAFAHVRGVIHRDLKPGNIMIGDYGEVHVLDWGLARVLFGGRRPDALPDLPGMPAPDADIADGQERAGTAKVSGTPAYMSPEQARGEAKHVDQRSDVWALGAILYHCLTLHPPIAGASGAEVLSNASAGIVTPPETYPAGQQAPRELLDIVAKAMHPDRAQRYADAGAMAADLNAYLDGRGRWRKCYEWRRGAATSPLADWMDRLGQWKTDDAGLFPYQRSGMGAVLLSRNRFFGDVRLEIEGACSEQDAGELSLMLAAPEPDVDVNETDGYCLQTGADGNTSVKIAKNDVDVVVRTGVTLQHGRTYSVAAERIGNKIVLEMDGEELISFADLFPLPGLRVGLYGYGSGVRITSLRIYRRGLDAVVSCMAVPDHDLSRGRHTEALSGYLRIADELAGREEGWMARYKAGLARLEAENPVGAEAEFARLDGTPGEALAHLGRSLLAAREGDYRRELLRLGAARRASAGTDRHSFILSRLWTRSGELHSAGQHEASIAFFKEVLAADPSGGKRRYFAKYAIAEAHFHLGQDEEAVEILKGMFAEHATFQAERRNLFHNATAYLRAGARWGEALEICDQLAKVPDAGLAAATFRANVEIERGNFDEAERILKAVEGAVGISEDRAIFWVARSLLAHVRGQLREAVDFLKLAGKSKPQETDEVIGVRRAWLYAQIGDTEKAMATLAATLKVVPHRSRMQVLHEVGRLCHFRGDDARAADCYEQVLANLPRSSNKLHIECELDLALLLMLQGRTSEGHERLQRAVGVPFRCMAGVLAKRILNPDPDEPLPEPPEPGRECPWSAHAEYFYYLGEFARAAGQTDVAVRAYNRAMLETTSPWRQFPWLAAMRMRALGRPVPSGFPIFPPVK